MEGDEEISLIENFRFVDEMTLEGDKGHVAIWCVCLTILQAHGIQLIPGS